MKSYLLIIGSLFTAGANLYAQDANRTIQRGNDLYKQQQYQQAESAYNEVVEVNPNNTTAKYNRSLAIQKQGRSDEAVRAFDDLAFKTEDRDIKAKSYYNKGAILSIQKKLEESIEEYKKALRLDPNDTQARENLQKALLELKKKKPKKDDKKKQQQQQQKPQPKMNQKEAEQRLKLLEQKEREVQERLQKEKSKTGGGQPKDW